MAIIFFCLGIAGVKENGVFIGYLFASIFALTLNWIIYREGLRREALIQEEESLKERQEANRKVRRRKEAKEKARSTKVQLEAEARWRKENQEK